MLHTIPCSNQTLQLTRFWAHKFFLSVHEAPVILIDVCVMVEQWESACAKLGAEASVDGGAVKCSYRTGNQVILVVPPTYNIPGEPLFLGNKVVLLFHAPLCIQHAIK